VEAPPVPYRPGMLPRAVTSLVLLLCWWVAAGAVAAGPVAAVDGGTDGPLPHVGDRGRAADAPEGLSISPGIQELVVPPGRRVEVRHLVANATGEPLELRVETPDVTIGRAGPELQEAGTSPPEDDTGGRLVAPVERLTLAPGDGVELVSTAELAAGDSGLHALRLSTAGGDAVTAFVVLVARAAPAGLEVTTDAAGGDRGPAPDGETPHGEASDGEASDGEAPDGEAPGTAASVSLTAGRHAVVDVRIRIRSWLGVLSDRTLADLVVGPDGPRVVAVERPVGAPPGRLRIEVAAADRAGETAGSELVTSVGLTAPIVAFVLLLVAGSLVAVGYRSGRLGSRREGSGSAPLDTDADGPRVPDARAPGPPTTGSPTTEPPTTEPPPTEPPTTGPPTTGPNEEPAP
jgi:hypothetical protein